MMSFFEAIPFETKFKLTIFETKKALRNKFGELHFQHLRTPYSILMTFLGYCGGENGFKGQS